jgi:outer membrane protein
MKRKLLLIFSFIFLTSFFCKINAQDKNLDLKKPTPTNDFEARIGVVDMKRILNQSKAYQSLVEQFEEIRRKHRNSMTKQEDFIRDEESDIVKQKNVLSKDVYAEKVKALNKKINELKQKQTIEAEKIQESFQKSTNKIQGALVDVLSILANNFNLNLVFAKGQVILVGKELDLTEKAVKELNKVLPNISIKK